MDLVEKENLEINYWRDSGFESPKAFTKLNFLNKLQECDNLDYKITKYEEIIRDKKNVLEIGAGQGWASCFLKSFYLKEAHFTVTDISPHAVKSITNWERIFEVNIDKSYAAKSYELAEKDAQFDLIFCYASAHHFVLHEETLTELKRVLSQDGHIIFLYEPTCSKLFYPLHYYYVNNVPHHSPEDVLIPAKIKSICSKINLKYINHYDAHQVILRSIPLGIYFWILKKMPFLQRLLPSSSDLLFSK